MRIADILKIKGRDVVTVRPDATVSDVLGLLAEHRIGAIVVSEDGSAISGIVSERDIVRHLHSGGVGVVDRPVSDIMTKDVYTCGPDTEVADLAQTMTDQRIRHLPVVVDGKLAAIVSIGDAVKHRIAGLTAERDQLVDYIQQ